MLPQAIRTQAVTESRFRMLAQVLLQVSPLVRIIPNLLAKRTNVKQPSQRPDFVLQSLMLQDRAIHEVNEEGEHEHPNQGIQQQLWTRPNLRLDDIKDKAHPRHRQSEGAAPAEPAEPGG